MMLETYSGSLPRLLYPALAVSPQNVTWEEVWAAVMSHKGERFRLVESQELGLVQGLDILILNYKYLLE